MTVEGESERRNGRQGREEKRGTKGRKRRKEKREERRDDEKERMKRRQQTRDEHRDTKMLQTTLQENAGGRYICGALSSASCSSLSVPPSLRLFFLAGLVRLNADVSLPERGLLHSHPLTLTRTLTRSLSLHSHSLTLTRTLYTSQLAAAAVLLYPCHLLSEEVVPNWIWNSCLCSHRTAMA